MNYSRSLIPLNCFCIFLIFYQDINIITRYTEPFNITKGAKYEYWIFKNIILTDIMNKKVKDPRNSTIVKIAKALELSNDEFAELCGYRKDDENDKTR